MPNTTESPLRFVDLFCGIGGFHIAAQTVAAERGQSAECVFASDIDPDAQKAYHANFGQMPIGNITQVDAAEVPEHEVLFAGFPCQAFSICGDREGFDDVRGTLLFDAGRDISYCL